MGRFVLEISQRTEAIELALRDYEDRGEKLREPVEFRGERVPLEVVRLSVDVPLLNHDNSRLGALLETHPDRESVLADPSSSKSQSVLSALLRSTEKYKDLLEQLKDLKQVEPGVITRGGMLVDGNTRLVALREIGETAIDVAVLPVSATAADFFDVEMSIQLRKLVFQDYTFTAQLKLIEKLTRRFDSNEAIFKALGWQRNGEKRLAEQLRWLAIIEEIREVSGQTYQFFDNKSEFVKNLDDSYQHLLAMDPIAAENLKWSRIFALNLGLNKDEIREINESFLSEQLKDRLDTAEVSSVLGLTGTAPDVSAELDSLLGGSANRPTLDMKEATKKLIQLDEDNSERNLLFRTFKTGARELREERVKEQILTQPLEYLDEITDKVEELSRNLASYINDESFDTGKFQFRAKKMVKAIKELDELLKRYL